MRPQAKDDKYVVGNCPDTQISKARLQSVLGTNNNPAVEYFDDFIPALVEASSAWILNAGTNDFATAAAVGGTIAATTGGSDNDASQIVGRVPMTANKGGLFIEARIYPTAVNHVCINFGFTDLTTLEIPAEISATTITTNASDACVLCFDTDQTTDQWYFVGVAGDTDATGNAITGVAPAAATWTILRIEIDPNGQDARAYVNGKLVGTLTANAVTNTTSVYPTIAVETRSAAADTLTIDWVRYGHLR